MKEFSDKLQQTFSKGLRPYHKSRRGTYQFFDLYNFKPTKFGVVPYEYIEMILPEAVREIFTDESFPFPQLFIGKKFNLIAASTKVYMVDKEDWSIIYELDTYDPIAPANTKVITVGNAWEFADFWDSWFLTNGACTVFSPGQDEMVGDAKKVYVSDTLTINTAIDHKGRVVFGGFNPKNFWGDTWNTFWNTWYASQLDTGISHSKVEYDESIQMPIGDQWIWWSSVGGGDALQFFFPSLYTTTGPVPGTVGDPTTYGASKPFILDFLKKNEQGFAPMPVQGLVIAMRALGDFIIVYSTEGVTAIRPISSPTPSYSIRNLQLGGIASRNAVAGDDSRHVYLDRSGILVEINATLNIKPLGYREYFFPLLGTDISISHSANLLNLDDYGEYFISTIDKHFYLNEEGLCEHGQQVTSAFYYNGVTQGMGYVLEDTADVIGRIGVDTFDFGMSGIKTIEWVRLVGTETLWAPDSDSIQLQVALDYRYKMGNDKTWTTTAYKGVNDEGLVYFPVASLEFRLRIKITDYEKLDLDYATFGVKQGDKRYERSIPINKAVS